MKINNLNGKSVLNFLAYALFAFFLLNSSGSLSQLTVTKTYTPPSSVSVDGCGTYCTNLPGLTFSPADFTSGACSVTDVNVNITWTKTDGTCGAPGTGSSYHNETNFRIDGPSTNVILVAPNTYTGNGTISTVSTTFNQGSVTVGGVNPVSGTFGPNNGNLNNFNGDSPFGVWTLRAGDTEGEDPLCISSYSVTVSVALDNSPPMPVLPTLPNVNTECSVDSLIEPSATDNCGAVTVTNNAILPITNQGTTVVTWTYSDDNGNSITQSQNIVVADITPPMVSCPGNQTEIVNALCAFTLTDYTGLAAGTDNCSGTMLTQSPAAGTVITDTTTFITITAADASGNTGTCTFNVTLDFSACAGLECTNAIVLSPLDPCGDQTTETGSTVGLTASTETLLCGTSLGSGGADWYTFTGDGGTWTTSTVSAVTNYDTKLWVYEGLCGALNCVAGNDDFSGVQSQVSFATTSGATYYVVVGGYSSHEGNYELTVSNVEIIAPIADTVTLPDITAECEVTSLTAPTATDNCSAIVTVTNDVTLPITAQGTTVVTWTYDDGNGNTSTQTQNIVIAHSTAPVADLATLADVTAVCSVTSLTVPTATEYCGGTATVTNDATLPITTQGTTVVTWTYTDANGNSSTQTQNIVIADVTAPIANLATLADVTAECSASSLTSPTATDNCGGVVTVTNNATLPITSQGTTVVTWTYTDAQGNSATQAQNVVITDLTPPVADLATLTDVASECSVSSFTAPAATDNCGGVVTVTNNATLPITSQGTTVVTWTYTDAQGNSATQAQNVVITDLTPPVADLATLADVTAQCEVTSLTAPTATDNCGGVLTVTNNATLPITSQGTAVVTWTYTDAQGNSATQAQNVVITDVTAPVADLATLTDVTAQCEVISLTAPTATENCLGVLTVTNNATLPITAQGTTVVTWTYDDGNGNTSTQTQNVVITDVTAPLADLATLADVNAECLVSSLTAPTATENCGGTVTKTNDVTLPITTQGTTVVTWTYTDANGNSSTQTQNVVITDVTAPVADLVTLADVTAQCEVISLTSATATDNCVGAVTVTNDATLPITAQGTTVVTWTYTDAQGNSSIQGQNVVITDVTAPVADLATLTDVTAQCEVTSLNTATATDNCGGVVTVTNNATLPITSQGTTVVIWAYTDAQGNSSIQAQNVVITDVTAPVADLATLADVTAQCEVTSLTAPTATDNCSAIITVTDDATLPITAQGTTVVTWTYDDGNGNILTQTQNVVITDVTAPAADLATLADVTAECSVTSLTAPTATDNCSGMVTVTNDATLPITTQGTTLITWTYSDADGNSSTQTQNIVITDVTAPAADLATLADVTDVCSVTSLTAPTATENCSGMITVTNDATLPISTQGTTIVTWTYSDGNGNSSIQTQNIVITDNTAPIPNLIALTDSTAMCSLSLIAPTAIDACEGVLIGTPDVTFPITAAGLTVVTWTYDDGNGNVTMQTQNITITLPDAAVTQTGSTLTANSATATYQWLDCDNNFAIILGATNQTFTPSSANINGNYALEATEFGCSDISACFNVNYTGLIETVNNIEIQIYPNPNDGKFNVELLGLNSESLELRIVDLTGRILLSEKFENISGKYIQKVDISQNESGVYIVNLIGDKGIILSKNIVKD
jgi:hypothetical protein